MNQLFLKIKENNNFYVKTLNGIKIDGEIGLYNGNRAGK